MNYDINEQRAATQQYKNLSTVINEDCPNNELQQQHFDTIMSAVTTLNPRNLFFHQWGRRYR